VDAWPIPNRSRMIACAGPGEVDPVVEAVDRRVHGVLRVREGEAREELRTRVRPAVVVRVLEVEHVGGRGDDDALLPAHHSSGQDEPVREDRALFGLSVLVS
jgi:hypothetical protein